jgi:DNA invertase Pin-like site-specific DNA recombinase
MRADRHEPLARHALAFVLAGGRGSRLVELTDRRAKPAVYFGGKSRIIDFALSNAVNSGIRRIAVATQYKAHSLIRHLQMGWKEKISGARSDRRQLPRLMAVLSKGDVLVVTRLDRLARSTRDLLNLLGTIAEKGAGFKSLRDTWADTTTAHGRLMLTVLGGLAEFERELIRTRTGEGRERAKARGVVLGRKPKLTGHQRREAIARREAGEVLTDIARFAPHIPTSTSASIITFRA